MFWQGHIQTHLVNYHYSISSPLLPAGIARRVFQRLQIIDQFFIKIFFTLNASFHSSFLKNSAILLFYNETIACLLIRFFIGMTSHYMLSHLFHSIKLQVTLLALVQFVLVGNLIMLHQVVSPSVSFPTHMADIVFQNTYQPNNCPIYKGPFSLY